MKSCVYILSLGCPRNLVDSEVLAGILAANGYRITDDVAKADIAILSTCVFINDAKEESIEYVFDLVRLKKQKKIKKIIVAGCFCQRYPENLKKEIPEIDAIIGFDYYPRIHEAVEQILAGEKVYWVKKDCSFLYDAAMPRLMTTPAHYAYIKISEGCNHTCSFCIIPKIKGPLRSRSIDSLISETRRLVQNGAKEIILIGQDTTTYGLDLYKKPALDILLDEIAKVKGVKWLRLLYTHPALFTDSIIKVYKKNNNICRYVDLPIQHISNHILKLMGRPGSRQAIIKLIKKVRREIPNVALRSSLIVGFPHENKKDFQELLDLIEEIRFERLGLFKYSQEEGTKASLLKKQLSEKVKDERFEALMLKQQEISRSLNESFLNKTMEVIIDKKSDEEDGLYLARSQYDAPEVDGMVFVKTKSKKIKPGDIVEAKIVDTYEYDLVGEYNDKK
jgi:ribosomal protein S12 methylthiotransferase